MSSAWEELVARYADGRAICNCGRAYYTEGGEVYRNGKIYHDGLYCEYGCSANQYGAKEGIAKKVLEELDK